MDKEMKPMMSMIMMVMMISILPAMLGAFKQPDPEPLGAQITNVEFEFV